MKSKQKNYKKLQQLMESAKCDLNKTERYLLSGEAINWVCDEITGALFWAINAWLLNKGITPDFGNGWHSMRTQFYNYAPQPLQLELSDLFAKLVYLDMDLMGDSSIEEPPSDWSIKKWKDEAYKCLVRAKEVVSTIEKECLAGHKV